MDDTNRARFFVRLAGMDLSLIKRDHLRALQDALWRAVFTHDDRHGVVVGLALEAPAEVDADGFRTLAARCRELVTGILAGRAPAFRPQGPGGFKKLRGGRVLVTYGASYVDVASSVAHLLLAPGVGPVRLRRCALTECGAVFVREGRQRYCSPLCSGRASQRAWRARQRTPRRRPRKGKAA